MTRKADEIAAHFGRLPTLEPESVAVRHADREYTWRDLGDIADGIEAELNRAGLERYAAVGWLARNDPAMIGALIGLIKSRHCVSPLNPHQPPAKTAEQLRSLNMAAVVGVERDFTPELRQALSDIGAVGLVLEAAGSPAVRPLDEARLGPGPFRNLGDDIIIERLTSGTTGEAKRIQVASETFAKAVELGARSEKPGEPKGELKVKRSPSILLTTFSHSGGMWGALLALNQARPVDLHEKFEPHAWADAVERTGAKAASLVPSMITMVLESGVEPHKIQSLIAIRCGTAALDPETQRKFEEKYKVPVLVELGASEFMGGIAGWSLADHKEHGVSKRGSVGRPRPDMEVRVTDVETDAELPAGQVGIMNLKSPRAGPDWVKTTDLASLDEDGFLYLHGRADEAINRGGFKVLPDKVAEILRLHPAVREAGVLAVKDTRLGQVPVAFVETIEEAAKPTGDDLKAFVRENAAAYMVPVSFEFVDALPRTLSLKIDRPALRSRFQDRYEFS